MRYVVFHLHAASFAIAQQAQFNHQLAAVADTQREGVGAFVEVLEGTFGVFVPQKAAGPAFGGAEYVGVRETAAEHYHIHILESFAACHKVGHVYVFDIEAGQIERICHLAVAVHALFANDCRAYAATFLAVETESARFERALETAGEGIFERLARVVLEAQARTFFAALYRVEHIRGLEPYVAQEVDSEQTLAFAVGEHDYALFARSGHGPVAQAAVVEQFLHAVFLGVLYLNEQSGVLGKEYLQQVVLAVHGKAVGVELEAALGIGEAHFEQSGNHTAGAYVVHSGELTSAHQFLYGIECLGEVFG